MNTVLSAKQFQKQILSWFDQFGRMHLPWQQNKTPYRVWVSEIMLQQTQVNTVIPYFERFMQCFPDLETLAKANIDEVLHLWAGLGYYSRARNLHGAANYIVNELDGHFPDELNALLKLSGVGESTAGAILAIAFNQQATILDGNVKRVLARLYGIRDPINEKKIEDQLWQVAKYYTPHKRVADYTQAMMDLGATLCTRGQPRCEACPLNKACVAHQEGIAALLPRKKATKPLPVKTATLLILMKNKKIFLQKRPAKGIWGGLWSLPEIIGAADNKSIKTFCRQQFKVMVKPLETLASFRHSFTHYHLDIFPVVLEVKPGDKFNAAEIAASAQIWYNPKKPEAIGLPKPIQSIMRKLL